ncbi:uncharacterized protein LMH87_008560 [Akanthomyces muscarius]|uniref:Histidine kinase n=1 Tax=Akanthomyces muscarius TaxID=2231603 RepID=A0A9W8QIA7_AKAMU|nr:uncharacterized protein LMH87_008560 [Akanthomyces muscarius]KAJ4158013.1 hypothetical protein LMH87_008560 [Akanthomyces muscarius]
MDPKQVQTQRSVKVVPESVREREVFKYEPFLQDKYPTNRDGRPPPSADLATSTDVVLTSLAQLGLYQTGTERAFISLFDANSQYIIAEATQSTPLIPGLPGDESMVFNPGDSPNAAELPLMVVHDLTTHEIFSTKPYCRTGPGPQFYAAVPIRTSRGINIGTYSVRSSRSGITWDSASSSRLRQISRAIMGHLATNREKHAYRRNARVTRGLGSLIEGKSTLVGWEHGPNIGAFADNPSLEGELDKTQQRLERQERLEEDLPQPSSEISNVTLAADEDREPTKAQGRDDSTGFDTSLFDAQRYSSQGSKIGPGNGIDTEPALHIHVLEQNRRTLFAKASNILRESFEVEGCIFFDISVGSYRNRETNKSRTPQHNETSAGQANLASSSDEQPPTTPMDNLNADCDIIAFATTGGSSINSAKADPGEAHMSKQFLAKLLRRYPNGKVFNFGAGGELHPSDASSSSEDDGLLTSCKKTPASEDSNPETAHSANTSSRGADRPPRRVREGMEIYGSFAGARSVAFMPIWDAKRERWSAAGFLYTFTPARSFTVEGELSLLKAFVSSISAEVYAQEALESDKAKSDALGSLSHELRSPLHGIILSTELLNDTNLSVFQGNAAHTIEICCRTLLDTIDHLLDYANINNFLGRNNKDARASSPVSRALTKEGQFGKKRLYSNARLDGLVEEVIESVFAGFNFQSMSIKQLARRNTFNLRSSTDTAANAWMDKAHAMEQMSPGTVDGGGGADEYDFHIGPVLVYLRVDSTCKWMFYLPGGAIRRIIMNLVGNALKFTTKGAVWVTLGQAKVSAKLRPSETLVKLVVQDTGKGISEDFIRYKLYKPFSKEDEFASGTGLGLSIVKKIVASLRGRIDMESTVGVGTKFTIILPLEQSGSKVRQTEEDRAFAEQEQELRGLRVQTIGIMSGEDEQGRRIGIVEDICRNTLHLDVVARDNDQELKPDIVVWTPNVVICQDALTAYGHFTAFESSGHGGIFEFVSQPIGPRKLAQSIQRAFRRWTSIDTDSSPPVRPAGLRNLHNSNSGSTDITIDSAEVPALAARQASLTPSPPVNVSENEASLAAPELPELSRELASPVTAQLDGSIGPDVILIVDDNRINREVLSAFIHKLGRKYEMAVNGKEALDTYMRHPDYFAVILMDISMPVMNGFEATRAMRKFEHENRRQPTPIIALSGLASNAAQREALESGVNLFLSKPVRFHALSEAFASIPG